MTDVRTIEVDIPSRRQFFDLLTTDRRWSIAVAHRRAGKTVACVQKLIKGALECKRKEPRFAYVAPLYNQAKDVAWNYVKHLTIPLGGDPNESELRVDLPNGSRIRLYGADNPDRLRGLYLDGCVLDEYADMHSSLWGEIIRPMLADRQGWAAFIGTAKGHNSFFRLWLHAQTDPAWYAVMLKASETGIIQAEELADARRTMSADQYAQEFECSFEAAIQGAYYAAALAQARKENRIGIVPRDPLMPVKAFFDIGVRDATVIWVVQFVGLQIRVLDYYEVVYQPLSTHLDWLRLNGYGSATCYLPHDGAKHDGIHAIKYEDHIRAAGFKDVITVKNQGTGAALKRVDTMRPLWPSIWIDEKKCQPGIEALASYHERIDDKRQVGLGPDHDWACLSGDTEVLTRYGMRQIRNLPERGEILTPCGWKQYVNPRITRTNAPLVEVEFADGFTVKCTPDHLFLTASGWRYAELLHPTSLIRSSLTQSHSILTAASIACGLATDITAEVARSCIERCGKALSGLFQRVVMSIIGMTTRPIMQSTISNAWRPARISATHGAMGQSPNMHADNTLPTPLDRKLLSGMRQTLDDCGTGGMPSAPRAGPNGDASQRTARSAERNSRRLLEKAGTRKFIAAKPAKWLRIVGVKKTKERQDVWCLTVPDTACFSLSNGAVVHNSHAADAFGLIASIYDPPDPAEDVDRDRHRERFYRNKVEKTWLTA